MEALGVAKWDQVGMVTSSSGWECLRMGNHAVTVSVQ